jgi:hypothetical protein
MPELSVGAFTVRPLDRLVKLSGETPSGIDASGMSRLVELVGPYGLRLTIRDTNWASGERDVVATERHDSPERFDTLIERLRLSVLDRRGPYVELRQARLRPNGRAGLFDADLPTLNAGAGLDVEQSLISHGALEIGTRERLLGDVERTRKRLGARIAPSGEDWVPIVAYVLTRVAPVALDLTA